MVSPGRGWVEGVCLPGIAKAGQVNVALSQRFIQLLMVAEMIGSWSNGSTIFENKYFQSSLGLLSLISFVRFQRHPMKFNFLRHSVIFFTRSNYIFNNIQFFDEIQLYFWRDSPLVALGKTTHCCFGFLSPEQRFSKTNKKADIYFIFIFAFISPAFSLHLFVFVQCALWIMFTI